MIALRDTHTTWLAYALVLGLLAAIAYRGMSALALDTDDFEYLRDAAAASQDLALLFSTDRVLPGRPVAEIFFLLGHSLWGQNAAPYHLLLVGLHVLTSLLLAQTFRRLGADLELSLAGGLLFLLNVAHFRAVQWIACLVYPVALSLALIAIVLFIRYLATERRSLLVAATLVQTVALLAHAGSICAASFCLYLAWRRHQRPIAAAPLLVVSALIPSLLHYLYPQAPQSREIFSITDPVAILGQFLGYLGRGFETAHWLVVGEIQSWEMVTGAALLLGVGWLIVHRRGPEADWALFTLLALVPFAARDTLDPSRFLYLSSAGSSLVLAWFLREGITGAQRFVGAWFRPVTLGFALFGLIATSIFSLHQAETVAYYSSGRSYDARRGQLESLRLYKKAFAGEPRLIPVDGYVRMAMSAYRQGDLCRAELNRGIEIYPGSGPLYLLLSIGEFLQADSTRYHRAARLTNQLLNNIPNPRELKHLGAVALHNVGLYYAEKEQSDRATEVFGYALSLRPDYALALGGLAEVHKQKGQPRQAIEYYQRFLQIRPKMAMGHFSLAALQMETQDLQGAVASLERGVALEPHHADRWYKLAQLYRANKQAAEAENALGKALAATSAKRECWIEYGHIAYLYHKMGQMQKALALYREVTKALPAYPPAHFNLGLLQLRQGHYAEAVDSLRHVVQLSPEDEEAHKALALAKAKMESAVSTLVFGANEG
jgi:tetratricopeptide (TPR) repeat protein